MDNNNEQLANGAPHRIVFEAALTAAHVSGDSPFEDLARAVALLLDAEIAIVARANDPQAKSLSSLAWWQNESAQPRRIINDPTGALTDIAHGRYFNATLNDNDAFALPLDFHGHIHAMPISDASKHVIGALIAVSANEPNDALPAEAVLDVLAARTRSELTRHDDRGAASDDESLYRTVFETSLDGLAMIDEAGFVVDVNPAVGKLDGFAKQEVIGYFPPSFRDASTHETFRALIDRVLEGETVEAVSVLPHKNGGTCTAETRCVRMMFRGRPHMLVIMQDVSEQKRREQDLARSEQLYRSTFDASLDGLVVMDKEGNVVDVNPALMRLDGFSREELLGEYPPTLRDPAKHEIHRRYIDDVLDMGSLQTEGRLLRKDGSKYTAEMRSVRIDFQGEPHILVVVRDISDQRFREEQLVRSEEQYRTVFEGMVDGLALIDEQGIVVDLNQAMLDLDFYDRDEIINQLPPNYVGNDAAVQQHIEYVRRILNDEKVKTEFVFQRRDRSTYTAEVRGIRVNHDDKPHVLLIIRDISLQKEHDAALAQSENRLRATVATALDCVITMDEDGNIMDFNPAAEECFGYTRAEVIGKPLDKAVIPPHHREAHRNGLRKYLNTGIGPYIGTRIEVDAMRKDGTVIQTELAINVAEGSDRKIFVGYLRDITEQKRAAEQSEVLEAQLRQAQKMEAIGHLTGGVAHDFNNILTSILGYVTLARDIVDGRGEEKLERYLDRAERAGERARDLIAQMLTFSRGQQGERSELNVVPVVKEALALLESSLPASIEMADYLPAELPPTIIDPVQFEQIVVNLCINARDAMDGIGGMSVSLRETVMRNAVCSGCRENIDGHYIELAVADTGPGIDPNIVERIFEPFFTTKDVGKGTGMGLSTVHGIVHDHDGHAIVDSTIGVGTTMRILLPVSISDSTTSDVASASESPIASTELNGKVLIVDDNVDVSDYLEDLLDSWGLEVTVHNDSSTAREHLSDNPQYYDLVITDQTMPRVTGMEIAAHIQSLSPDLPVILYTGYSEVVTEEMALAAGIRAFLRKPLDTAVLRTLLGDLLD